MRLRYISIVTIFATALLSILMTSVAHAQDFLAVPPEIANVLVKVSVIVDSVMGTWVSGNALNVNGVAIVNAMAQTVVNTTHFLAVLVTLF